MRERTVESRPSRVLYHQFRPSISLHEGLLPIYAEPGHASGFLFDSPRRLSLDLQEYRRSLFDNELAQATKAFTRRHHEALKVRSLGARMVTPALLGVFLEIDREALNQATQSLFEMSVDQTAPGERLQQEQETALEAPQRFIGEERPLAHGRPIALSWMLSKELLVKDTALLSCTLRELNQTIEGDNHGLYTATPARIVGRDRLP